MTQNDGRLKRRWLYIPFLTGAVIFTAYGFLWRAGAAEMKKAVLAWVEDQRAAGMDVAHGEIKTRGFPFFLRAIIDDVAIAAPGEWRWRGEQLAIDALPYDLNRLIFSPAGVQTLTVQNFGVLRLDKGEIRASIANDDKRGWVFSANVAKASGALGFGDGGFEIGALVVDVAPDARNAATITLNLTGDDMRVSTGAAPLALQTLQTSLALTRTDALTGAAPQSQWRAAGGAFQINGLIAETGDARFSAQGEISLDHNNYPAGRLHTETANPAAFVRMLGDAGLLTAAETAQAEASLTLAAMAGGGKISAPIEFQNGVAEIAGVKIADLPRIE